MQNLLAMLEQRVPNIRATKTWQRHTMRWTQNYLELGKLLPRNVEIYEKAVTALVNHIANQALIELGEAGTFEERQRQSKAYRQLEIPKEAYRPQFRE